MNFTKIKSLYAEYRYSIFLIAACLLGLVPILWFDGRIIAGEEFYALNYLKWGEVFSNAWAASVNFGEFSNIVAFKTQYIYFFLFHLLDLSNYISLVLFHVLLSVIPAALFYRLLIRIYGKTHSEVMYFLATLLYILNPYFLNISPFLIPPRLVFAALPLLFHAFLSYQQGQVKPFKFSLTLNSILLVFSAVFVNLPSGAVLVVACLLFMLFQDLVISRNSKKFISNALYFTSLFAALNLWWLIPTGLNTMNSISEIRSTTNTFSAVNSSKTFDTLGLFGSWAFREKIYNTDLYYFPFNVLYDSFPGVVFKYTPFLMVILALLCLIKTKALRSSPLVMYIVLCLALFMFLSKGTSGPGGDIFQYFFNHIPLFWIFREPYAKFMPVVSLCYALLFPIGITFLLSLVKSKPVKLVVVSGVFASLVYIGLPFINNSIVWHENTSAIRSYRVEVPNEYTFLNKEIDVSPGYFLQYPSGGFTIPYNWKSGYSGNPYLLLSDIKTINPESGYSTNTNLKTITNYLYTNILLNPKKFIDETNRYYVNGLISQKDTLYPGFGSYLNRIDNLYLSYKTITNSHFDIYKFTNPDTISVYANPNILKISKNKISSYSYLRSILDPETFISLGDWGEQDIFVIKSEPSASSESIWTADTSDVKKDFTYFIYDPEDAITEVSSDEKLIKEQSKVDGFRHFASVDLDCCSRLQLSQKPIVNQDRIITNGWLRVSKLDIKNQSTQVDDSKFELFDSTVSYLLPLDSIKTDGSYVFSLKFTSQVSVNLGLALIEYDSERNAVSFLINSSIDTATGLAQTAYINNPPTYRSVVQFPKYYLALYVPSNLRLANPVPLNITSVIQSHDTAPYVVAVKKLSNNPVLQKAEYMKISDSFYTLKLSGSDEQLVQLKQSYNKYWEYVPLSQKEYIAANNNSELVEAAVYIRALSNGRSSQNIEVYSNGWVVPGSSTDQYAALLFVPNIFATYLFYASVFAVLVGVFVLVAKIKCYY